MAPPLTPTLGSAPSLSEHTEQHESAKDHQAQPHLQQQQPQQTQLLPLQEENEEDPPSIESTDVTIKTDVDPHDETTTTTTIVHLPFQLARQCPPPKVISWMKSNKPTSPKSSSHYHHHHHRHHPHQRPSKSPALLHHLLPFFYKRRGASSKTKKSDRSVTVFSIQVTVLGRVLVPPSLPTNDSQQDKNNLEQDIVPTKTVPAQLDRSETTSYVIHRTFEDFEHLSEMVLRLEHALHAHLQEHHYFHHHNHHHHHHDNQISDIALQAHQDVPVIPADAPPLTALHVHHPYPGLYQVLLKKISNVKANQRAFDASSTTHGFDEEGAFERVLELNQYLENVWYWLLPENIPPQLDLSAQQYEIMQWLKPSAQSHADGQQMRDRREQDEKEHPIIQQYGSISSLRKKGSQEPVKSSATESATRASEETAATLPVAASSTTTAPESTSARGLRLGSEGSSSAPSLPSLSSMSTSSCSSASSPSISTDTNHTTDLDHDDNDDTLHGHAAPQGLPHTPSTVASSTFPSSGSDKGLASKNDHKIITSPDSESVFKNPSRLSRAGTVPRGGLRQRDSSDPLSTDKVKRRISLSHVLKSMTFPLNNPRHTMHDTGHRKGTSASISASPTLKEAFHEEIVIWKTVTTKNHPGHH
ncbi:hypothetical protein BC939DRAFT_460727 [Gamsiella multidivaricata]|uniref:uncharacterized protein n=1 Tax=Gamsiella multidivaricata TaxID=101098 RepID=UPI002220547B|nr:uncharacterized protein BC939DRAFT_460727 [Gamsiella multidivaricata]KAG0369578.1 hypothetical protein BGZ54_009554 [Gamsiella multidivaricata]KAI7819264.1 hypothetical protein BC939DRAFT_460727 [Gamsiella multidivaricata]